MLRSLIVATILSAVSSHPAAAGLDAWTSETEANPFSGGAKVSATFMTSFRSGVVVLCDTAESGIRVRAIPGFDYSDSLSGFTPTMKFAFDGKVLFGVEGETGSVGNNLAIAQVLLTGDQAQQFVDAFAAAKKQIAVEDGIADGPHLLKANGSTAAGAAIVGCLKKQTTSNS